MNAELLDVSIQSYERFLAAKRELCIAAQRHKACRLALAEAEKRHEKASQELIKNILHCKNRQNTLAVNARHNRLADIIDALKKEKQAARLALLKAAETAKSERTIYTAIDELQPLNV